MTAEATLRIVVDVPTEVIDLLERLVTVMEDEYEQKYSKPDDAES